MRSYIILRISGHGLNIDEITDQLDIGPIKAQKKGDTFISRWHGGEQIIYQEDFWISERKFIENNKLENEIESFVMQLKSSAAYLKSLAQKHSVTVWVSSYPDGEQANVHITSATISALSEIGATLDCSMVFLKDFYEGNY